MYQDLKVKSKHCLLVCLTLFAFSTTATAEQEIYLGREADACSGSLSVKNKSGQFVSIQRGARTTVDVAIDGNGYWYWKCGSSLEYSRGISNYRQRVKRLKVLHSTQNRSIDWRCYDLL